MAVPGSGDIPCEVERFVRRKRDVVGGTEVFQVVQKCFRWYRSVATDTSG
jgi:hypothetical protein